MSNTKTLADELCVRLRVWLKQASKTLHEHEVGGSVGGASIKFIAQSPNYDEDDKPTVEVSIEEKTLHGVLDGVVEEDDTSDV